MSKLSVFVRKYGEEIGIVGKVLLSVGLRIPMDLNDRKTLEAETSALIQASQNIASSYNKIDEVLKQVKPSAAQVKAAVKAEVGPVIEKLVAELVRAELEKLMGVSNTPPPQQE